MTTPVADFVRAYAAANPVRLHMPGHKGVSFLGCEALDITEIAGADSLYEAGGIIAGSEANAAALFGSARTFYAAEGSSQCIRAMLALALFGSTSPSYLILQSLDLCNRYLAGDFPARLAASAARLEELREQLRRDGWAVWETDPLKVTVDCAASGWDGRALARRLRGRGIECEYCDQDDLVLMWTPENGAADQQRLLDALGRNTAPPRQRVPFAAVRGEAVCSVREAMFLPHETMSVSQAVGRICGAPAVGCPPAVPIVSAGETVSPAAAELFRRYGVETVEVLRDRFPVRRG